MVLYRLLERLAVSAGLEAVFTDWYGYQEAKIAVTPSGGATERVGVMAGGVFNW